MVKNPLNILTAALVILNSGAVQTHAADWKPAQAPLSGAIYTQLTDVESEGNGLVTYDREVIKMDIDPVKAASSAVNWNQMKL